MPLVPLADLVGSKLNGLTPPNPLPTRPDDPFYFPRPALQVTVVQHGTSTPVSVYDDQAGTTPLVQPTNLSREGLARGWVDPTQSLDIQVLTINGTVTLPLTSTSGQASSTDPLGFGFAVTVAQPQSISSGAQITAGNAQYALLIGSGQTVSGLRMIVTASVGNISAGLYNSTGSGTSRVPSTQLATSGAIPCPAVGSVTVSLTSTVKVPAQAFAAVSADSTAAIVRTTSFNASQTLGLAATQAVHPLPATATPTNGNTYIPLVMTP